MPKTTKATMFSNIDQIKEFLEWAKSQGIQAVKVADIEVSFSPLAFLPQEDLKEITNAGSATLAETDPNQAAEDEELLFHSSML
jgi:O-succinylbenzoate synthase